MAEPTYRFTRTQLTQALDGAIEMYLEFRDKHGQDDANAKLYGTGEILDGIDADRELAANDPTERLKLQLLDTHWQLWEACEALLAACNEVASVLRLRDQDAFWESRLLGIVTTASDQAKATGAKIEAARPWVGGEVRADRQG